MILPDVNVLVCAFRREEPRFPTYSSWLHGVVNGSDELALHDPVLAGFVRVVTNRRIVAVPAPTSLALDFVGRLLTARRARWVSAGTQTWSVLGRLVDGDRGIGGDRLPDAHLAAVALAHGCRIATADRGFARYPGLRYFDPAAA